MMFCFKSILQIWIILIGFRDTNDFVDLGICKHEFKFTCRGYCRFTLSNSLPNSAVVVVEILGSGRLRKFSNFLFLIFGMQTTREWL